MATIQEITLSNGKKSYRATIRRSGSPMESSNFDDRESAVIWANYRESIIEESRKFSADDKDMLTINDILKIKFPNESREYKETCSYFGCYLHLSLNEFTYEKMKEAAISLVNTPIYAHGSTRKEGSKLRDPVTVARKFAHLSSAINYCVSKGYNLPNDALKIVNWLKQMSTEMKASIA